MSLSASVIAALVAKGMSAQDILDIALASEIKADPTNAERQARFRARRRAESNTVTVTRDEVSLKEDQNPSSTQLPNEAIASLPIRQPISEATEIWNEAAGQAGWPQVRALSANRSKLLSARLREHGLDGWKGAILKARSSAYLGGHDPPSWFAFPWLIKAENFLKLIEGNYDRRHSDSPDPTLVALASFRGAGVGG